MATVTTRKVGTGVRGMPTRQMDYWETTIDCATTNITSADVVQLFSVPANTFIHQVGMVVDTAEGGTLTIDVGITGGDTDGFLDGVNGNAAAGTGVSTAASGGSSGYQNGYYSVAADTVDAIWNNDADAAILRFWMLTSDVSDAGSDKI